MGLGPCGVGSIWVPWRYRRGGPCVLMRQSAPLTMVVSYFYYYHDAPGAHMAVHVFDGPARATTRDTRCTSATTATASGVFGSLSARNGHVGAKNHCLGCIPDYCSLLRYRIKSMVPAWVHRRQLLKYVVKREACIAIVFLMNIYIYIYTLYIYL